MSTLLHWDQSVFQWINGDLGNPVFDLLLPLFRTRLIWLPLYIFFLFFFSINFRRAGWVAIVLCCLTAGLADTLSSKAMKPLIQRVRPCNDPVFQEFVHLRVDCGSGLSFTSSHASNHMAFAVILILLLGRRYRWIRIPLIAWALVIGFSQIYVGVHYPIDVLAGFLLGTLAAYLCFLLYRRLPDSLQLPWLRAQVSA